MSGNVVGSVVIVGTCSSAVAIICIWKKYRKGQSCKSTACLLSYMCLTSFKYTLINGMCMQGCLGVQFCLFFHCAGKNRSENLTTSSVQQEPH